MVLKCNRPKSRLRFGAVKELRAHSVNWREACWLLNRNAFCNQITLSLSLSLWILFALKTFAYDSARGCWSWTHEPNSVLFDWNLSSWEAWFNFVRIEHDSVWIKNYERVCVITHKGASHSWKRNGEGSIIMHKSKSSKTRNQFVGLQQTMPTNRVWKVKNQNTTFPQ